MIPTLAGPPSTRNGSEGALPRDLSGNGVRVNLTDSCSRISWAVTIGSRCQACWASRGHLFDEPQLVALVTAPRQHVCRAVIVDSAHSHRVNLDRSQPNEAAAFRPSRRPRVGRAGSA
jgi:hypothetical protein